MDRKFFIASVALFVAWFGAAVALLAVIPTYSIYYVVQPLPFDMVVKQIVFDGVLVLLLGALVAYLYRSSPRV